MTTIHLRHNGRSPRGWPLLLLVCSYALSGWGGAAPAQDLTPLPPIGSTQTEPAASSKSTQEVLTRDAPVTFVSKVNLVPVSVVVRDNKGRAIGNLTKDDFKLFDNGKLQYIAKFSVERPNATVAIEKEQEPAEPGAPAKVAVEEKPAAVIASRFVAYVFDDVHLKFADIAYTREAAARVLATQFQPADRVAIYTTSGQLVQDFTDDQAKLQDALLRLRPRPSSGDLAAKCPDISFFLADLIVNRDDGLALMVATENYKACSHNPYLTTQETLSMALSALHDGEYETRLATTSLKNFVRRLSAMPGQRTIVFTSPGFFLPFFDQQEVGEIINQAIRAKVIVSTLDSRGVWTPPEFDASRPTPAGGAAVLSAYSAYMHSEALAQSEVLGTLAEGTGGVWIHDNNDLKEGFKRLAAAPEYVYVLAFSPSVLKSDGKFHNLKVTLKEPKGLELSARKGYYAPKRETDAAEQARQDVEDAVFSRDLVSDLPVELHTQFFKSTNEDAKLSVLSKLNLQGLTFRKQEGRNLDNVTLIAAVFDTSGNLVSAQKKEIEMKLKEETLEQRKESGLTIRSSFDVKIGSYVVRLVVRDNEGRMMATANGVVEIP